MIQSVAIIALWAEDVPAAARFYHEVLGLTPLPHHAHEHPHFRVGPATLTIRQGRPQSAAGDADHFPLIAFGVADLDTAVEHLKAHGVELPWGITAQGSTRFAMFPDPAGNLIELVEGLSIF